MTRSESLRNRHGWTKRQMADFLGVDPSTVSRLESRTSSDEPGAMKRLLDLLEADPSLANKITPEPVAAEPVPAA